MVSMHQVMALLYMVMEQVRTIYLATLLLGVSVKYGNTLISFEGMKATMISFSQPYSRATMTSVQGRYQARLILASLFLNMAHLRRT